MNEFTFINKIAALLLLTASIDTSAQEDWDVAIGPPMLVPIPTNPVHYYSNDSRFPFLSNSDGTANITFWVDGLNFRSLGASLDTMGPIQPTNSVLSGPPGTFDNGGAWLLNAIRRPDGVIVGFYHAEDHSAVPRTEWNSMGVALSNDDGASFRKLGQIIGIPNRGHGNGGLAANTVVWDHLAGRWLAWGGAYAFESTNTDARPGTWRGYDTNGQFTVAVPCDNIDHLGRLPGLDGNCSSQAVTWNDCLNCYLMLYTRWGDEREVFVATSTNGIVWSHPRTLLMMPVDEKLAYPFIIGATGERAGADAWLIYQRTPPTQPGRYRDMIQRKIHFKTTKPQNEPKAASEAPRAKARGIQAKASE